MDIKDLCRKFNWDEKSEAVRIFSLDLERSWRTFKGVAHFTLEPYFAKYLKYTQLPESELLPILKRLSQRINQCAELQLYVYHAYMVLYKYSDSAYRFGSFPLVEWLGNDQGMLDFMIALGAVELYEKSYAELKLPPHYAHDAAQWLWGTVQIYRNAHGGYPGIDRRQVYWLRNYIDKKLFRIGRLEFMLEDKIIEQMPAIYRNQKTHEVVALANYHWLLDENGYRLNINADNESAAFITTLEQKKDSICGYLIKPEGYVDFSQKVILPRSDYEVALNENDTILAFHIPGGGNLTLDRVRTAMFEAVAFFKDYLDLEVKAFNCISWIFNPSFHAELPGSNLDKFMHELYLYPFPGSGKDGLFFIFGQDERKILPQEADNSIRQAFCRIQNRNETLKSGGAFILSSELPNFGHNCYKNFRTKY